MQAGTRVGISSIQTGASEACCIALRAVPSRLFFGGARDSAERVPKRVTACRLAMVIMLALLGFAKLGFAKPAKASHTGATMQIIARHAGPAADDRAPIRSVPRDARQRLVYARLLKPQAPSSNRRLRRSLQGLPGGANCSSFLLTLLVYFVGQPVRALSPCT